MSQLKHRYIVVPLAAAVDATAERHAAQQSQRLSCTAAEQAAAMSQEARQQAIDGADASEAAGNMSGMAPLKLDWAAIDAVARGYQVTWSGSAYFG